IFGRTLICTAPAWTTPTFRPGAIDHWTSPGARFTTARSAAASASASPSESSIVCAGSPSMSSRRRIGGILGPVHSGGDRLQAVPGSDCSRIHLSEVVLLEQRQDRRSTGALETAFAVHRRAHEVRRADLEVGIVDPAIELVEQVSHPAGAALRTEP